MMDVCMKHEAEAGEFSGCVYCDRLKQVTYSANLQRFVSCLILGIEPPKSVLDACPHHAHMYAQQKASE